MIGIAIQEMLDYLGVKTDHTAIRSSSYTGIGQRGKEVHVHGLSYLQGKVRAEHSVLLVDDVFETGLSLQKIIQELQLLCGDNMPVIKIATLADLITYLNDAPELASYKAAVEAYRAEYGV